MILDFSTIGFQGCQIPGFFLKIRPKDLGFITDKFLRTIKGLWRSTKILNFRFRLDQMTFGLSKISFQCQSKDRVFLDLFSLRLSSS